MFFSDLLWKTWQMLTNTHKIIDMKFLGFKMQFSSLGGKHTVLLLALFSFLKGFGKAMFFAQNLFRESIVCLRIFHSWGHCYPVEFEWHFWPVDNILFTCTVSIVLCSAVLGVRDKWPKSKYQNLKSTQWFSYKLWTKNSKEPIVYLHNWPLPEQHHFLKIQWEIHFFTFLNTDRNAKKKNLE